MNRTDPAPRPPELTCPVCGQFKASSEPVCRTCYEPPHKRPEAIPGYFLESVGDVQRVIRDRPSRIDAHGKRVKRNESQDARAVGLGRSQWHALRAGLPSGQNPRLSTLIGLGRLMGLRLAFVPLHCVHVDEEQGAAIFWTAMVPPVPGPETQETIPGT